MAGWIVYGVGIWLMFQNSPYSAENGWWERMVGVVLAPGAILICLNYLSLPGYVATDGVIVFSLVFPVLEVLAWKRRKFWLAVSLLVWLVVNMAIVIWFFNMILDPNND